MTKENWQTIAMLPAVYRGRCLAQLLWEKPVPLQAGTQFVEWTGVQVRFTGAENIAAATIEICEPDIKQLTKILLIVLSCAVRGSADRWTIDWTTSCSRWGTPQRLSKKLIDDIDELNADKVRGHMNIRGGRLRPYSRWSIDAEHESIRAFMANRYGHISIEIVQADDRLTFHLDNASPAALAGLWKQVMQRLGMRVSYARRKRVHRARA